MLYLFENKLEEVSGLDRCPLITHLYLQNNALTSTAGLYSLQNLTKLYAAA